MTIEGISSSDFNSANDLKIQAKLGTQNTLPQIAKQFEGIYLQSMLKSMRLDQHFINESSPFTSKDQSTFQDMLDVKYATNITGSPEIEKILVLGYLIRWF